ncbi:MAG: dethiobiotin synthase [Gammaproteobacteria bacterium]|jgi:dethiobiotin synthetase
MTGRRGLFVTGTDTGVGKTVVTLGLMQCLQDQGQEVAGMKPVASGCERTPAGLRNADAVQLQQQASMRLDYRLVNPVALEAPIAPHIAAQRSGQAIVPESIRHAFDEVAAQADWVIVEGIGGWRVPLGAQATLADLAMLLGLDVILVVGLRLGCLNHALLTAEAIARDGLRLAGWVANCLPPAPEALQENVTALKTRLSAPLLGIVPDLATPGVRAVAAALDVRALSDCRPDPVN